jgi:hypothetical protein
MSSYLRSVLVRLAGAVAGAAIWFGLIVLALSNFDSPVGFPEEFEATWPFWLTALVVTGLVFWGLRRAGPGPGWGVFAIGVVVPFVGLIVNARVGTGGGWGFWIPIAFFVLVPIPRFGSSS